MADPGGRKIIHLDMDAFYASVEQRDNPALRGKPVVVGGSPEGRGVVASCSYEARKFGIRSAMSARKALSLCPHVQFVRPQFSKYKEASQEIRRIMHEVTDLVEPLSLDEAYLDVTQNKKNEPLARNLAIYLRERIKSDLNLTASAGVAPNKFLAKLASDMRKPDGLMVISPERVAEVLLRLPVEKLWGVGPATAKRLHREGVYTTEDVRQRPKILLEQRFGKFGGFLYSLAHGIDHREVKPHRPAKSRGSETTFGKDIVDKNKLKTILKELTDEVTESLAQKNLSACSVTLKLRYADFTTITRSKTQLTPFLSADELYASAEKLLDATEAGRRPTRLIGVSVSKFSDEKREDSSQLVLFPE